jgi:protein-L-isoaspartate(D-aspartate) O-methyltransferase
LTIANAIYVNAGTTRPAEAWLDNLAEGGRLMLPLTTDKGFGDNDPSVPIERRGAATGPDFLARWITPVAIIPCESCRDAESEAALSTAFAKGGWEKVTHLCRHDDVPADRVWLRAPGWCLAHS